MILSSVIRFQCHANGWINVDGRHSFSLSTFDPSGKLGQVDYAAEAAALGTPVAVIALPRQGVFLAAPQVLPSPLIHDDGTARFARVTSNLLVAHSGLSADGRVLAEAAQQMAVQHEYTYDELIPVDIFLEELSLLFQEYTMKPGSRPFGCTLIIAHLPTLDNSGGDSSYPMLYRIDPSGAVSSLENYGVVNGNKLQTDDTLLNELKDLAENPPASPDQIRAQLATTLKDALLRQSSDKRQQGLAKSKEVSVPKNLRRMLVSSIYRGEGMVMGSYDLHSRKSQ